MKAIDYTIKAYLPHTHPGHPIDNIQSKNKEIYTQFEEHAAFIELEFTPCVIASLSIAVMASTNLRVIAYSLPDKSDAVDLLEKKITSFNDELKVGTYKASECFVSYQYLSFTGMRLELENLEERRPFNLNYISLMTPKEVKQDTPSPRPLSRTNFYKNSFTTPTASKPRPTPKDSSDSHYKQSTLNDLMGFGQTNGSETLLVVGSVEETLQNSPEIAKQQSRLLSNIKRTPASSASPKKKKPTNSYSDLLNGYLVSCVVEDEMMKYEVIQLCEVLGAVYIEDVADRPSCIISDGSQPEMLPKLHDEGMHIISIEWLRECLTMKDLMPIEIYSLY